jgi:CrcB protein
VDKWLAVGLGGFLGALARYGLSGLVHRCLNWSFPTGTLLANTVGCLLMGVLMSLLEERQCLGSGARVFLMIGLLGSFTTFSTFGYETLAMLRAGDFPPALWNVVANVFLGLFAVWVGWTGVRMLGA